MLIISHPHAGRTAVTSPAASAASQPQETSSGHNVSMVVIGLAVVARLMRDPRTYEAAIVVVIAVAAAAGLGRASQAHSLARLAAWDKRRNATERRMLKPGKSSG